MPASPLSRHAVGRPGLDGGRGHAGARPPGDARVRWRRAWWSAPRVRSWVREAAGIVAEPNRMARLRSSPISRAGGASGLRSPMVPVRRRRSRLVPLPEDGSRSFGPPRMPGRGARRARPRSASGRVADAGGGALGDLAPIRLGRLRLSFLKLPPRSRTGWRSSATPRMAFTARGPGCNLGFGDALALAQVGPSAGRSRIPGPRCSWNASPATGSNRSRHATVTDGLARLFGRPSHGFRHFATPGPPPSIGYRSSSASCATRAALDCPTPARISPEKPSYSTDFHRPQPVLPLRRCLRRPGAGGGSALARTPRSRRR